MRVLYLTHGLPYAPNRGDRLRAFHTIGTLREHLTIALFSLVHDREEASHVKDLRDRVATVRVAAVPRIRDLIASAGAWPSARLTHRRCSTRPLSVPRWRRLSRRRSPMSCWRILRAWRGSQSSPRWPTCPNRRSRRRRLGQVEHIVGRQDSSAMGSSREARSLSRFEGLESSGDVLR
jgi:hypothetical protein